MPDEPEAPRSAQEAQHWLDMYRRIVDFEEVMLSTMRAMHRELPAELKAEVQASNIRPMEQLIDTYRDRMKIPYTDRAEDLDLVGGLMAFLSA